MRAAALIVAAGRGERAGGDVPKQYRRLGDRPVIRHAVERFLGHSGIDPVLVVIAEGHETDYAAALGDLPLLPPVIGAADRQGSVRLGLEALSELAPDRVLIHDAARPLVSPLLIDRVLTALGIARAVLPALPVVDSLKEAQGDRVSRDIDRRAMVRAQTPQGFDFATILEAHRRFAGTPVTDDTAVAQLHGVQVRIVDGDELNLKITNPGDHARLEAYLHPPPRRYRTGFGYDVHRLVEGRPLVLCGLSIPHDVGLDGHSDADVALHALTDAVLGTIGAGDIGVHFPPTDARWKDAASCQFVRYALRLVAASGGRLEHVDLTILCERPKIAPHREAMRRCLAELTGLPVDATSIKATTTEGLGFTGRGEGIVAQAVATVSFTGER